MEDKEIKTLEKIIEKQGDCLDPHICVDCPFVTECYISFVNHNRLSRKKRVDMAADVLVERNILGKF